MREIRRKATSLNEILSVFLDRAEKLLTQTQTSKDKLYSIDAPEVECISKGKAHKRYEFGCKVSVALTNEKNWIVGVQALHGNPYDGHTLDGAIKQVERITGRQVNDAFVDKGYQGHNYTGDAQVHITGLRGSVPVGKALRKRKKRRSAVEPKIGHLKSDNRMGRNFLNHSADGIVGPYDQKEASYYTIRDIWSPVQIALDTLSDNFTGRLSVENRYYETDLNQCTFDWRLVKYPGPFNTEVKSTVLEKGRLNIPSIAPSSTGQLCVPLSTGFSGADALELTAEDPYGREIMRWSWSIKEYGVSSQDASVIPRLVKEEKALIVQCGDAKWNFSSENGQLQSLTWNGKEIGFKNGPSLYAGYDKKEVRLSHQWKVNTNQTGQSVVIHADSMNDTSSIEWIVKLGGEVELRYHYIGIEQPLDYCATESIAPSLNTSKTSNVKIYTADPLPSFVSF